MSRLFDGIDDYLEVASAPVTAAPLTMACWFYSTSASAGQNLFHLWNSSSPPDNYFFLDVAGHVAGDPVRAILNDTVATALAASTSGYATNAWQHACAVFASATDRRVFVNGGSKGTETTSRTPTGINRMTIGRSGYAGGSGPMAGRIALPAIWNVAHTDGEVAALAKGTHPLLIRPQSIAFFAPLWGTGSPEPDYTRGQRHLTISGPTVAPNPPVQSFPGLGDIRMAGR